MLAFPKLMMRVEWSLGVQTTLWTLSLTGTHEEYCNSPCLSLRRCVAAAQFAWCTSVKSMPCSSMFSGACLRPARMEGGRWSHINPV